MWKRFRQWEPKMRLNKWWVIGAIATPVFLWIVWWLWLHPDRRLQSEDGRPSLSARAVITDQHYESLMRDIGTIAAVVGGGFLLLNFRLANESAETTNLGGTDLSGADLYGADLNGADLNGANLNDAVLSDADLGGADLNGADLNGADLSGANLICANLSGANLICANLSGANLSGAELRYANLSGADLRYANLSGVDLRHANLSDADLNCALLSDANFSEANLSGALLFFINSRNVLNLEPLQLEAKPSPFLCNVALPSYSKQREVDPNRDCDRIPLLLSARYDIPLEEAQGIVDEARQHRWD
jgi:uncharacterized protein YjbI with pentapeptide repeats